MSKNIRRLGTALIGCAIAVVVGVPAAARAQAPENKADTGPRLDFPAGLATDGLAVYVANSRNNTIDKIDLTAHSISLLAGQLFQGRHAPTAPARRRCLPAPAASRSLAIISM